MRENRPQHPEEHALRHAMGDPAHPANHPDTRLLEGFLRGELDPAESRAVVRHLLTGCPRCVEVTRRSWPLAQPAATGADDFAGLAAVLGRHRHRLAGEQERAPRLLAEILAHSRARRLALVCGEERFHSLALGETLLERSRQEAPRDPVQAAETAELAVAVADRLDARLWGATLTDLLRARSWACLGEARRLAADLRGAERALAVAEVLLEKSGFDPLDRAELLCLLASLAQDQRRLDDAGRLLDRALAIYRRAGAPQLAAETLHRQTEVLFEAGRVEAADPGSKITR
jgi:tetratricopeptide (TPR) repeat protein